MADWITLRGNGTDRTPPLGTAYSARLRRGGIWSGLAITPFCIKLGADLFRHRGRPNDAMAIRIEKAA